MVTKHGVPLTLMSYSRKKHPFVGLTTAQSERADKRLAHRRERHAIGQSVRSEPWIELLPHRKQFGDSRDFNKGRKRYLPLFAAGLPWLYQSYARRLRK